MYIENMAMKDDKVYVRADCILRPALTPWTLHPGVPFIAHRAFWEVESPEGL
jgi:hypothetical protein